MDMGGIANIFRNVTQVSGGGTTTPAAPVQGTPQGAQPNKDGMTQNNSGADPANQNLDGLATGGTTPKPGDSPMDAFKDIFKIDSTKAPAKDLLQEPLLTLDPAKIAEAVGKMDFTKGIDPALMQKALQGDVAALGQILNSSARNTYMGAFQALAGIIERAVKVNNERFSSSLDGRFRKYQVDSSQSTNPVLQHESVKPVLASLRSLIAQQKPDMHPAEVAKEAENYFLSMGKALSSLETTESAANKDTGAGKEIDWESFLPKT